MRNHTFNFQGTRCIVCREPYGTKQACSKQEEAEGYAEPLKEKVQ